MTSAPRHRPTFEALFALYFPPRWDGAPQPGGAAPDAEADAQATVPPLDASEFIVALMDAVAAGDEARVAELAREAVAAWGASPNRDGSVGYYGYRVYREVNPAGVLRRMMMGNDEQGLERRLTEDAYERALQAFREEVDAEIRRRLAEQRGAQEIAQRLVRPLPEDRDFFRITADEEADMRRAVRQLARRLAARLARRRRHGRTGRLDIRRTFRRSLSTGGVPAVPVFRPRRPHRPDLVLLCDVSGSVAAFARFTLLLTHALQNQFSRVRSFAFVDSIDEITGLFADGDANEGVWRLAREAAVSRYDGHSDYGSAFGGFLERYADAVSPRSTVIVLGDARNNYRPANAQALAAIRRRARHVYWLNPEALASWGTGDSLAPVYGAVVDRMVECRNLRQLGAFVEQIA